MLIRFTVENWKSFRDKTEFSMIASKERQHKDRIADIAKYNMKVLPVAAIYGGNASGKTNLFNALKFAKNIIVNDTKPEGIIPVEMFLLDTETTKQPSKFAFEILIDKILYEYSFSVTQEHVLEERLIKIRPSSELKMYNRSLDKYTFSKPLGREHGAEGFLEFASNGTRNNQLFLTNAFSQQGEAASQQGQTLSQVYNWFKETLVLIEPNSEVIPWELLWDKQQSSYQAMQNVFMGLDTGVADLRQQPVSFNDLSLPEQYKEHVTNELTDNMVMGMQHPVSKERFHFKREHGKICASRMVSCHHRTDGEEVEFKLAQESSGTLRVLELLPAFLHLTDPNLQRVFVIDEIGRSLHTLLIRNLLKMFLNSLDQHNRSQLLFTTHDIILMDQHLMRRDEMWLTERDSSGASSMVSIGDYEIRNDKIINTDYLIGRMGGIPNIFIQETKLSNK